MKKLLEKRSDLCKKSMALQTAKFDLCLSDEAVDRLIKEQDKVYKKFKFYDNYIKSIRKVKKK